MDAKPFVKFAGGKTRLLPELLARVPREFGAYHEPFVGGGALFFALAPRLSRANLSDTNDHLMAAYGAVADDAPALVKKLRRMKGDEESYYRARARNVHGKPRLVVGARMIYLNKTCFNGLWRENRSGQMNAPYGHRPAANYCDEPNLLACSAAMRAIADLRLRTESFERVLERAAPGDFVFFDPPYLPASATADFTSYGSAGFGLGDHSRLCDVARELKARAVGVMITNGDHPAIRELYRKGFKLEEVKAPRSINRDGAKRGAVPELVIT